MKRGLDWYKREPLSPKLRFAILTRDRFTCQYCGAAAPDVRLHVDHIVAVADAGGNSRRNLVTACQACNLGKGTAEALSDRIDQIQFAEDAIEALRRRFPDEFTASEAFPFLLARTIEADEFPSTLKQKRQRILDAVESAETYGSVIFGEAFR